MKYVAGLVALTASAALGLSGCSREDKEVTVSMDDVPAAVRATLVRESGDGKVTEIEKEMKDGRTVYSADMIVRGEAWDITVAEDGTVVSKEREKDGDHEKDGEDKD